MKMVLLMYLEEDEETVEEILESRGVVAFSSLEMQGHGAGEPGWYGEVPPYRSRMVFAVLPDQAARGLLGAIRDARGVADPSHPIHAVQLAVEDMAECR